MKTILNLIVIVCFPFVVLCQVPVLQWQKAYGGTGSDYSYLNSTHIMTDDGGFFTAACSNSNDGNVSGNHGDYDFWVVKMDSLGDLEWQKSLGGSLEDYASAFQQTSDGGYIVVGCSNSVDGDVTYNSGSYDYWIVKLDSAGTIEWQKSYGGSNADYAYGVAQTADSGFIVAGKTWSSDGNVSGYHGEGDYWVIKLTSAGNLEWQKCLGGSLGDCPWYVGQTNDGKYMVAGTSSSLDGDVSGNHGGWDFWVVKLTTSGEIIWQKSYGGSDEDYAYCCYPTSDGNFLVAGETYSIDGDITYNHGYFDYWLIKIDTAGGLLWQNTYGGSDGDWASSVIQTSDGNYMLTGASYSSDGDVSVNYGDYDCWIVKSDTSGAILWEMSLGGSLDDEAGTVHETEDGGYTIYGHTLSNDGHVSGNHGDSDLWIFKLGEVVGGIDGYNKPGALSVFPNPAHSRLTVKYNHTTLSGIVKYSIYDNFGQVVMQGEFSREEISLDILNLTSGLYFLKTEVDGVVNAQSFIKE